MYPSNNDNKNNKNKNNYNRNNNNKNNNNMNKNNNNNNNDKQRVPKPVGHTSSRVDGGVEGKSLLIPKKNITMNDCHPFKLQQFQKNLTTVIHLAL